VLFVTIAFSSVARADTASDLDAARRRITTAQAANRCSYLLGTQP